MSNINEQTDPLILKKAAAQLNATEKRLTRAMVAGKMAWWEMELPSGKITFSHNKTRMLGLNGEDFSIFQDFMKIVHPEDVQQAMDAMYAHLNGTADVYECEYRMKNAEGNYLWFHDVGKIVYQDDSKKHIAGIVTEITARKKIEKQLKEAKEQAELANSYKNRFLANVSHEIRTPINGLVGFASLLHGENLDAKTKELYLDIIQSCSQQLLALINDLMDVSRIEAGEMKITMMTCPLHKILRETETTFEQLKHAKGRGNLKIKAHIPSSGGELFIKTDPDRLRQILVNLIGNALKFTEEGGIDFGYSIEQDKLVFYVSDTGIGMSKEDLEVIFQRFRRSEYVDKNKFDGTGLGLDITKGLLNLLGGSISVSSELGKGSVFTFDIPFVPVAPEHFEPSEQKKDIIPDIELLRGKQILIAEDEKINQMYLQAVLRDLPLKIFWAQNGQEAVDLFRQHAGISLVLMDMRMPVLDGIEAARQILAYRSEARIIAQTANALMSDRDEYLNSGFVDYISKPIDKKRFIALIEKWV